MSSPLTSGEGTVLVDHLAFSFVPATGWGNARARARKSMGVNHSITRPGPQNYAETGRFPQVDHSSLMKVVHREAFGTDRGENLILTRRVRSWCG